MMTLRQNLKIEFVKHNTSGAKIARKVGVHRTAVYHVLGGLSKSKRIRAEIARSIGTTPEKIWKSA
jgi:lambda repressor-like predicted transcriptional regulator